MERIHEELLAQLKKKGYSINSGMAVDARLVRSASSLLSKDKDRRETSREGAQGERGDRQAVKVQEGSGI